VEMFTHRRNLEASYARERQACDSRPPPHAAVEPGPLSLAPTAVFEACSPTLLTASLPTSLSIPHSSNLRMPRALRENQQLASTPFPPTLSPLTSSSSAAEKSHTSTPRSSADTRGHRYPRAQSDRSPSSRCNCNGNTRPRSRSCPC